MTPFRVLYLDMNCFFASVEQQLDPALRGRPVAITAVDSDSGACVAASYEAKAHGVRTGTHVRDARRLCPGIIFRPSRHRLYVRFNLAVADVLDRHAELTHIRSVDEFQLALSGEAQTLSGAFDLVSRLKAAVASEVGDCLRFSAGIGPNHLLAKIAGKLEKPDGCQWLGPENLPAAIAHLALDDLPGISAAMKARLYRARVFDVPSLFALDPRHARLIWRSVEGERFVRMLQSMDIPLVATERGGFGNSKVLSPEYRRSAPCLPGRPLAGRKGDGAAASGRSRGRTFQPVGQFHGWWGLVPECQLLSDAGYRDLPSASPAPCGCAFGAAHDRARSLVSVCSSEMWGCCMIGVEIFSCRWHRPS